uniref:Uncharacterized protein n=1 Tax=Ciona intestinalis TaxID=7719 RepID=H2XYU6_CIOIN
IATINTCLCNYPLKDPKEKAQCITWMYSKTGLLHKKMTCSQSH